MLWIRINVILHGTLPCTHATQHCKHAFKRCWVDAKDEANRRDDRHRIDDWNVTAIEDDKWTEMRWKVERNVCRHILLSSILRCAESTHKSNVVANMYWVCLMLLLCWCYCWCRALLTNVLRRNGSKCTQNTSDARFDVLESTCRNDSNTIKAKTACTHRRAAIPNGMRDFICAGNASPAHRAQMNSMPLKEYCSEANSFYVFSKMV